MAESTIKSPQKKRRHSEMVADEPEHPGQPTDGPYNRGAIWMDDGNIIIQAGQTQFKVYKYMLLRCSSVFQSIFSLPQPQNGTLDPESVDGCPVVVVHDSPEDIEIILSAIYFAPLGSPTAREAIDFPKVSAYLRLGIKYDITHLRDHAIRCLKAQYPSEMKQKMESLKVKRYINLGDATPFDVINLLHEVGLFSPLPTAYFMAIHKYTNEEIFEHLHKQPPPYAFASTMLRNCIAGRDALAKRVWTSAFTWLRKPGPVSKGCLDPSICGQVVNGLRRAIHPSDPQFTSLVLVETIGTVLEQAGVDNKFCTKCVRDARLLHKISHVFSFYELPSAFRVGNSWNEVNKKDLHQIGVQ
ncbi:hypothetical protein CVT24_004234 [Panaeolus cyanescens]|uniref:BTB domain-containing protein n=1 Tax=Panaeolus cyanescens TaxID=181874 RepID=A0A409W7X2_9AGAR|nr:hypothetical protein CVT24_004234 [Panaeolus cyanescens]